MKFFVGQQVQHLRFNYRGVIFDADAEFSGSDEWYEQMAITKPPKDNPWYHVLVHEAEHTTYVAERNLEAYPGKDFIDHPLLAGYFNGFDDGVYQPINRH